MKFPPEITPQSRRFKTPRAISALVLREMATTYGRSPGGYLWAVLEPAAGIALLTFVFTLALRSPPLGTSFALFYATGYLPFSAYTDLARKVALSTRFSGRLLQYPSVFFIDAIAARFILGFITHLMVFYIVIFGILLVTGVNVIFNFAAIASSLFMMGLLGLGVGALNCLLFQAFPVWERIWTILNRPLFIVSCIFFTFETVPAMYRDLLWYNPLIHIVGRMRQGFYPTYTADYVSGVYVIGFSLVCLVVGLFFLRRFHRELMER